MPDETTSPRPDEPFGGSLRPGPSPAVLAVDMMRAYFDPASALCLPDDDCLQSAARVLATARQHGVPVVHTRVRYSADGADGGVFFRKVPALQALVGDGPMGELMAPVAPVDDELVVVKQYASAFFGTSLASTLHARGIDTVVVVGVSTSGCIRATAVDAIQHGFVPLVVADAVGDRAPGPHEANLSDLAAKYAEVVDEATALDYLGSVAPGGAR
ncbi:isochorismatase family protein [Nocardioides pinisoli]|uniref:Isochorismatase family protein n=1 Tax=Nocardioides pinisoli TaxID=2950279 RepID=A0ABT1L2Y3_9ACTN|nr:isochorismatase family protein [Nocardioides pinisoli]MCP3424384.1 isochorismatase family protein [Nocardioides pinisoli]